MNNTIDMNNNEVFDFAGFMNAIKESTVMQAESNKKLTDTVGMLSIQVMANENMIKNLAKKMDEIKVQTEDNTNQIIAIKENDRITSGQASMITKTAYKRICDFLEPSTVTWEKYSKMYFQDLYRYLRNNCYLQKPNSETRKKDFDNVMNGFSDWYPDEKKLREKADAYAEARMIAKEQGYK